MPTSKEELLRRGITPHDIQHNQHRRAEWQDYGGSGLYMVTLCIEGRQALFGRLEGNIRAQRDTADFPHIVLSTLGRIVVEEELEAGTALKSAGTPATGTTELTVTDYARFHRLNDLAAEICNTTDVVLLDLANLG
jgi:hypothetical protein